ncbi:MAG: hypothetical protein Q8P67_24060 [archaeon]|nr:hypothetical protein [archaeon]
MFELYRTPRDREEFLSPEDQEIFNAFSRQNLRDALVGMAGCLVLGAAQQRVVPKRFRGGVTGWVAVSVGFYVCTYAATLLGAGSRIETLLQSHAELGAVARQKLNKCAPESELAMRYPAVPEDEAICRQAERRAAVVLRLTPSRDPAPMPTTATPLDAQRVANRVSRERKTSRDDGEEQWQDAVPTEDDEGPFLRTNGRSTGGRLLDTGGDDVAQDDEELLHDDPEECIDRPVRDWGRWR